MGAGKVLVDDAPIFALFGEDVRAAAVDFAATSELHGPVKRGDGGSAHALVSRSTSMQVDTRRRRLIAMALSS